MPLVTVVMPAYNVEDFIEKSIESVIAQKEQNWELIIVNDGSTDSTLDKITSFVNLDERIKVVDQPNGGVSSARNQGLRLAKGQYISFLDADDIYSSDYIELMVNPLIKGEADMTFCKYQEINGNSVISESPRDINTLVNDSFIQHLLTVRNTHANMAMMYSVDHLRVHDLMFLEGCGNGEDRIFVLKAAYFSRVSFIPEYLYYYIFREGSACRTEVSYQQLLSKLDGYLELSSFFQEQDEQIELAFYLRYIEREVQGIKNNLRRKLWGDLKLQKFQTVSNILEEYNVRYKEPFNVPQKGIKRLTNYFKMRILLSNNPKIWKYIFFKK